MLATIVNWYWTIALMVFFKWLMNFNLDRTTSKLDLTSWIVILIGPLFWPIILPLSNWELSHKHKKDILF
jgi:hypothetical protein